MSVYENFFGLLEPEEELEEKAYEAPEDLAAASANNDDAPNEAVDGDPEDEDLEDIDDDFDEGMEGKMFFDLPKAAPLIAKIINTPSLPSTGIGAFAKSKMKNLDIAAKNKVRYLAASVNTANGKWQRKMEADRKKSGKPKGLCMVDDVSRMSEKDFLEKYGNIFEEFAKIVVPKMDIVRKGTDVVWDYIAEAEKLLKTGEYNKIPMIYEKAIDKYVEIDQANYVVFNAVNNLVWNYGMDIPVDHYQNILNAADCIGIDAALPESLEKIKNAYNKAVGTSNAIESATNPATETTEAEIEEKAYEAPEDLAAASADNVDALNEAADEVGDDEAIEESDVEGAEEEEEPSDETVEDEDSEEEPSEEEPVEEDSEIPADDEEYDESLPEDESLEDPELDYEKRLKVFENTKQLLTIVTQNKESFDLRFGKGLTPNLAKDYRLIIKNFDDFIQVAEAVLINKFSNKPYNTLMKYYVSLTKVYDIIIRMTENFVTKYNAEIEN